MRSIASRDRNRFEPVCEAIFLKDQTIRGFVVDMASVRSGLLLWLSVSFFYFLGGL